jgi:DNA (cytosine-5)-methyltransferase 1
MLISDIMSTQRRRSTNGGEAGLQLLVRKVPRDLHRWIAGKCKAGRTQNEVLLDLLQDAMDDELGGALFAPPPIRPADTNPPSNLFTFVDLFAGIGGFRIGMTMNGGRCVFTSEWDKFCQRTYRAWFGEEEIQGDINDPELDVERDIPNHDVLCAGFPCQPFSIAGVSKKRSLGMADGFDDEKQGNLFFRICDVVDAKRPPVLFLENVKNLRSHDKGNTWRTIRGELEARGYVLHAEVIDARAWVPQHRERIFIVGFDRDVFGDEPRFEFPDPPATPAPVLGDVLDAEPPAHYTLTDHLWEYLQAYARKHAAKGNGFGFGLVTPKDVTRTLSARYYKDGSEILIAQPRRNPRRLTPTEAARLMGYGSRYAEAFGHGGDFPIVVSDTQAYKQFGNSVVPEVVEAIGRRIADTIVSHAAGRRGSLLRRRRAARREPAAV